MRSSFKPAERQILRDDARRIILHVLKTLRALHNFYNCGPSSSIACAQQLCLLHYLMESRFPELIVEQDLRSKRGQRIFRVYEGFYYFNDYEKPKYLYKAKWGFYIDSLLGEMAKDF